MADCQSAERWRWVPGYEGLYLVSDHGRVWSMERTVEYRPGVRGRRRGRILKAHKIPDGHLFVALSRDRVVRQPKVHQLVLLAFVGPCPPGQECRHLNGNPADNWVGNLCWGTRSENRMDAVRHGTDSAGERHGKSKLTWQAVAEIRAAYAAGVKPTPLARKYGVTLGAVIHVVKGRSWKRF
jgi:hypothetical protein